MAAAPMSERAKQALPPRVREAAGLARFRVRLAWRNVRRNGSPFVTGYLGGLTGIEVGAASHNSFYLNAINVDREIGRDGPYKAHEHRMTGRPARVDVVACGDVLPFRDVAADFVFASHVIEHFPDPIKALKEWFRVARRYVVVVVPHRDRTFDAERPVSTMEELVERHRTGLASNEDRHWSVWTYESFLDMCNALGLKIVDSQDPDDRVGNGFTVVLDATAAPRVDQGAS